MLTIRKFRRTRIEQRRRTTVPLFDEVQDISSFLELSQHHPVRKHEHHQKSLFSTFWGRPAGNVFLNGSRNDGLATKATKNSPNPVKATLTLSDTENQGNNRRSQNGASFNPVKPLIAPPKKVGPRDSELSGSRSNLMGSIMEFDKRVASRYEEPISPWKKAVIPKPFDDISQPVIYPSLNPNDTKSKDTNTSSGDRFFSGSRINLNKRVTVVYNEADDGKTIILSDSGSSYKSVQPGSVELTDNHKSYSERTAALDGNPRLIEQSSNTRTRRSTNAADILDMY